MVSSNKTTNTTTTTITTNTIVSLFLLLSLISFVTCQETSKTFVNLQGINQPYPGYTKHFWSNETSPPMKASWDTQSTVSASYYNDLCRFGVVGSTGNVPFYSSFFSNSSEYNNTIPDIYTIPTGSSYFTDASFVTITKVSLLCIYGQFSLKETGAYKIPFFGIVIFPGGSLLIETGITFSDSLDSTSLPIAKAYDVFDYFPGVVSFGKVNIIPSTTGAPSFYHSVSVNDTTVKFPPALTSFDFTSNNYKFITSSGISAPLTDASALQKLGSEYYFNFVEKGYSNDPNFATTLISVPKNALFYDFSSSSNAIQLYGSEASISFGSSTSTIMLGNLFGRTANDRSLTDTIYDNNGAPQSTGGNNQRLRYAINAAYGATITITGAIFSDTQTPPSSRRALIGLHHASLVISNSIFESVQCGSLIFADYGTETIQSSNVVYVGKAPSSSIVDNPNNVDFGSKGSAITTLSTHLTLTSNNRFYGQFPGGAINMVQLPNRLAITKQYYDLHLDDQKYHSAKVNSYLIDPTIAFTTSLFQMNSKSDPSLSITGFSDSLTAPPVITISSITTSNPIEINFPGSTIIISSSTIFTDAEVTPIQVKDGSSSVQFKDTGIFGKATEIFTLPADVVEQPQDMQPLSRVSFTGTTVVTSDIMINAHQFQSNTYQPLLSPTLSSAYSLIQINDDLFNNLGPFPVIKQMNPSFYESYISAGGNESISFSLEFSLTSSSSFNLASCRIVYANNDSTILNATTFTPSVSVSDTFSCSGDWTPPSATIKTPIVAKVEIYSADDTPVFSVTYPVIFIIEQPLEFNRAWNIGPDAATNSTQSINGTAYYDGCSIATNCQVNSALVAQNLTIPSGVTTDNSTITLLQSGVTSNGVDSPSITISQMNAGLYRLNLLFLYQKPPTTTPRANEVIDVNPYVQIIINDRVFTTSLSVDISNNQLLNATLYFENSPDQENLQIQFPSTNFYLTTASLYYTFYTPYVPNNGGGDDGSTNLVAIIVPIVVGVLVIGALIAGFIIYRRRRQHNNKPAMTRKVDIELGGLSNSSGSNKMNSSNSSLGSGGGLNSSQSALMMMSPPPSSGTPRSVPNSPSRTALKTSTTNINQEKYRLHPSIYDIIQNTPNFTHDNPDFPLTFTSTRLDFGMGGMKCQIDQVIQDSITIVNKSQHTISFDVLIPPSSSSALIQTDAQDTITLKPTRNVTITFQAKLLCTTKLMERIAINIPEFGHTFVYMAVESVLSTQLDYDELVFYEPPIGEGSFGVVYRGQWRGQDVAIKKLKIGHLMGGSSDLINDVYREMDLMNKLRHPNIVSYVGAVKTSDKLCLVSEFIPMGSLAKVLYKEKRVLTMKEKVRIALDTAKGCNFLHQCGIMHRDLKPDNILVVTLATDAQVCVKLTDFGTSKEVTDFDLSSYTSGIGTPIYMANEILEKQQYDNSADVYSYAIMFYELILGEVPFGEFKNVWEIPRFILSGKRPTRGLENVYPPIVELINECWLHDPSKRPTFSAIIPRLELILESIPSK